jgi:class 3 adenylate cyclase
VERPSGTVTFLFTDIVGSTRLWEAHPQEMRQVLADHERLPVGRLVQGSCRKKGWPVSIPM